MKLTYLFFIASFFQTYASSYGQNTKVTLDLNNVTVEEAFSSIEDITDYRFLYNIKSLDLNRKISINSDKEPLSDVLQRLFESTNVEFKVLEKQIVLKVAEKNNIYNKTAVQQQSVTGLVSDENNIPLAGVTIIVAGTQKGVTTDFDGQFKLQVLKGDILVFNYLGYSDVEIEVTDETVYNVQMKPSTVTLDQVVISTGYQTLTRERTTGAFGSISNRVLETKINQDIVSKITNEIPGLLLDDNQGLLVRGVGTINGVNRPLIVIDGIKTNNTTLTDINPNDVKDITVLKDASAASIWGIEAANGVIVIVTKKGSRNSKTVIDASINSGYTPKLDIFDTNIGNSSTQINYQRALFEAQGSIFNINQLYTGSADRVAINNEFYQLNPVIEALLLNKENDFNFTQSDLNARLNELSLIDARKEYSRNVLRPTLWNQYNMSISGGGEKQDFRASITFNNNENGVINDNSKQFIVNFRNSIDISDKLKASFIANFSQTKQDLPPTLLDDNLGGIVFDNPTRPRDFLSRIPITSRLLDDNGNYVPLFGGANAQTSDLLKSRGLPYDFTYNVLQEYDNANNRLDNVDLRLQAALDYEFFDGLDLSLTYRYALGASERKDIYNENTFDTRSRVNLFAQIDSDTNRVNNPIFDEDGDYQLPTGSILSNSFTRNTSHTFRGQLNFDKDFNDGLHQVVAIAGYEVEINTFETDSRRVYGYDDSSLIFATTIDYKNRFPNFFQNNFLTRNIRVPFGNSTAFRELRNYSYYANAAYTFNDKYTVSGSTRLDDTSFFGASDDFRNKPLYSVGLKWDAFQDLFTESNIVNYLSLRATYGITARLGNGLAGSFLQAGIFRNDNAFTNDYARITNYPNNQLQLEKVRTTNLGLDFELFDGFIIGSVDYYSALSEDLLSSISFNPTIGLSLQEVNAGELTNKGVDVQLGFDFSNPDKAFSYNTTLNFSVNKNKLTKVEFNPNDVNANIRGTNTILGRPISTIYSYRFAGLDSNGAPQYFNENNEVVDFRTDISVNEALKEEGTLVPTHYGSWVNNFSYKNFSLRVLSSFKAGHVFRYTNRFIPGQTRDIINVTKDFNQRWRQQGDEAVTSIPAIPSDTDVLEFGYANYSSIDSFVDDASHIRLSQINLGYSLPSAVINKIGFKSFRLGFQIDNVAVWDFNKWGVDPENQFFPQQRTFSLNINTSF